MAYYVRMLSGVASPQAVQPILHRKLEKKTSGWVWGNIVFGGVVGVVVDASTGAMYRLTPGSVDANMETRTAVVDGKRTIQVAIVMRADPSWEKIGQLRAE
jgi:hypothetical protein